MKYSYFRSYLYLSKCNWVLPTSASFYKTNKPAWQWYWTYSLSSINNKTIIVLFSFH